jgi:hypothetical protein
MPDVIPQGVPFETLVVRNTSACRGSDASVLDTQSAWLVMARLLQQPVRICAPPTTGTAVGNYRYRTVRIPPGVSHIHCAALYAGGTDGTKGPRFSAQMAGVGALGTASRLPAHVEPGAFPGTVQEAVWSGTLWSATQDIPVADDPAHLVVAGIAGRVSTQWQDAHVRMEVDPAWGVVVHAWTVWPVMTPNASTP